MKRYFKHILLFIGAAALLAGCTGKELAEPVVCGGEGTGTVENGVPMVFTASFSQASKTSVREGDGAERIVEWEVGDQIRILCLNADGKCVSVIAAAEDSGKTSSFAATLPVADAYYAVYPATSADSTSLRNDGRLIVKIPSEGLDGSFASASICVAKADASKVFSFRSAASILKFTLDADVDSLRVANVAGGALAGEAAAVFDASGNLSVYKGESVTPLATTGKLLAGVNYLPVLAGTYTKSVAARFDNTVPAFFDKGSVDFNVGHIVNVGSIQSKAIRDYFITEDGDGDGSSWASPGNASTVVDVLHRSSVNESAHTTMMRVWKSQGAVFHFAGGKFVFGQTAGKNGLNIDYIAFDDYSFLSSKTYTDTPKTTPYLERVKIQMLGGYTPGSETPDPKMVGSVLSGDSQYRIMAVRDLVDLRCEGLTFADAKASDGSVINASTTSDGKVAASRGSDRCGAAIYLSDFWENNKDWKAIEEKTRPHLDIHNCCFRGNESTYSNAGGDKCCIAMSKGQCHVTDSRFMDNKTINYGVIGGTGGAGYVENVTRGEMFFDGCYFTGNKGLKDASQVVTGTTIYNNSKGTFICLNNCTFRGNTNEDGYANYGIVYSNRNYLLSNCTFVERLPLHEYNSLESTSTRKLGVVSIQGDVLGCRDYTLVNNIILDESENEVKVAVYLKNDSSGILTGNGGPDRDARLYSGGGNLLNGYTNVWYTAVSGVDYGKWPFLTNRDRSEDSFSAASLGLQWDEEDLVYKWSGEVKGFIPLTATEAITQMGSNYDIGDLFVNWLSSEKRLTVDALGNERGDNWVPGAYQANINK